MKYIKKLNIDFDNWDEINNFNYKYYWFINIYDDDVFLARGEIGEKWFKIKYFKNLKMNKVIDDELFRMNLFFNGDKIKSEPFFIEKDGYLNDFYYYLTNSDTIDDKYFNKENIRMAKEYMVNY